MALVKFGGGVAGISGKIGGTVYARNKAGAYARSWAKPTTTPTPSQTVNRNRFGNQAQAWTALSSSHKSSWDAYAATVTRLNRQGDAYTPTGRQIYLEASNALASIGQPTVPTAPPPGSSAPTLDPMTVVNIISTAGVLTGFDVTSGSNDAGTRLIIEATPPTGGNITNFSNLFRQVASFDCGESQPFDVAGPYGTAFTNVVTPGQIIAVRGKLMFTDTGLTSPPVIIVATVG